MTSARRFVLLQSMAAVAILAALGAASDDVLPPWTPGTLDIHQIATGRGNAALYIFPGGATMLVDAGDAGNVEHADPRPDGSRPPGEWIARYVQHMLTGRDARLDYAVLTHFHPDHIGGFSQVADMVPVGALIDRGYEYLTPGPTDRLFANYRRVADTLASTRGTKLQAARPGRADQIVDARKSDALFEVRVIAANDLVWTGHGDAVKTRFPALDRIPVPEDRPTENMCSVALRIRYGRFDYFTGGDMPGYPVPGAPAWHDVETEVARVLGPTDVHVVNHHGSIEEENLFWLATLRSRVMVVPAWAPTHPSPDVLKRMLSRRVYPQPRDIFVLEFREPTKATIGPRASQVTSDHGHVVIRVEPGGERYRLYVLDDTTESYRVLSVHGPYEAE